MSTLRPMIDSKNARAAAKSVTNKNTITTASTAEVTKSVDTEETYRTYPCEGIGLPVLPDCNSYFSGKYKDCFWHQNSDQVLVYLPIVDSLDKNDISAVFEVEHVKLTQKSSGKVITEFTLDQRLIPDGSFWVIETDRFKQRYIQLDLEKRYRMINWRSVFTKPNMTAVEESHKATVERVKSLQQLQELFSAAKRDPEQIGNAEDLVRNMAAFVDDDDSTNSLAEEAAEWRSRLADEEEDMAEAVPQIYDRETMEAIDQSDDFYTSSMHSGDDDDDDDDDSSRLNEGEGSNDYVDVDIVPSSSGGEEDDV